MSAIAKLFDGLIAQFGLRNDVALAEWLEVEPCNISRLRAGRRSLGAELVLRIHEVFGWTIADIKAMLGMKSLTLAVLEHEPCRRN